MALGPTENNSGDTARMATNLQSTSVGKSRSTPYQDLESSVATPHAFSLIGLGYSTSAVCRMS